MSTSTWTKPTAPWFHLLVASPSDACDWLTALSQDSKHKLVVRSIRGRKCVTTASFFDETAAALQFPYYFGENWDALHDCLADLSWLHTEAVVLCIADADQLLAKAPDELKRLAGVVQSAAKEWNQPEKPKTARSFHVVLQVASGHEAAVRAVWHAAGVYLEPVVSGKKA
jgi:RNAse (barnase) inhibitor barstar